MSETRKLSQQETMVRGTAWSTAGNFISRLIGALYIIPWYAWMGKNGAEANALFGMGYEIYAMFLSISTVGIPVAVAKLVSKYNTLGQSETSIYMVKKILHIMALLGAIFAAIMYIGAPFFASLSHGGEDLVRVLRSLTLAVLVFPSMSVLRGYFQGYNNLKPGAMSQIAEQIVRVIWMLVTAFYIMKFGSGDYVSAVTQSTFAAFVGMFASIAVLVYFLWKDSSLGLIFGKSSTSHLVIDTNALVIETVREAIPFIITGSAIQVFKIIDQFTFGNAMAWFTDYSNTELQVLFSYFSSNPSKVTMILIAVASSIGGVGIALLTENYVKKDRVAAARLVINNIRMLMIFIIPAVIGATILAKPLYTVFYGVPQGQALGLFVVSLLQVIILAIYTILAPMLQALFQNKKAIKYFAYGMVIKLIIQIPFIYVFQAYGPLLSTAIGLIVPIVLMYREIHDITHFNREAVKKSTLLVCILTAIMGVVVWIAYWLLGFILPEGGRATSFVYLVVIGFIGVAVYGSLALLTRLLDKVIGSRADILRQKFHIY
ncbi:MAG: polysaccharide biosynthesis protein [Streptococcus hyointestinalis]|uniref:putative polysaccharide biosynthesis protein n=1 Tax=Streptococcus hyointestinalis TaxID=1337 RepID=UPI0023F1CAF9|nr:polysaccharide biosynthesis protein [Streptococcus hyointestinalis]MCI6870843.1 polysaccharide biosynthesis protein [Streptococcus hyointestinalis]MDD6385063.1 polysaccharide biosynthesis protein [Streptococcus hyointestinalis]MDD7356716.1 polysaccharide biosynthesis protein [Streptococcus hyointestinalis]MDY4554163.1 polysaccharide biosynthesis protein [Streptococcus hyointestinalis]